MDNNVINFYETKAMKKYNKTYHNPSFANTNISHPSRIAVIAPSGSGKTNWIINFLYRMPDTWAHVYVVHQIEESFYDMLREKLNDQITFFKGLKEVPQPKDLLKTNDQVLFIWDDVITEKNQKVIEDYYVYGRKCGGGITSVYLSQSYFKIPKTVRLQLSYVIILKLSSDRDLKLLLTDYSLGATKEQILEMYNISTKEKFNFMKISLQESNPNKKFSMNWTQYFTIS